ncbi:G-protein coupled receptor daf-37-like [Saccostrea cucullata]|uniref:G-protein coupled receptor daf-37-like n=1 Tax=Saccostrea cuccullata TaxID=36930 RepID=UPI002ED06C5B
MASFSSLIDNEETINAYNLSKSLDNSTELNSTFFSEDTSSQSFYDFVHALYLSAIPLISTFGIIGNVLSIKVFLCSTFKRQPSSIYLAALSVSDTWFLVALLMGWLGSFDGTIQESGVTCMISIYVTYVTGFLSVWYVVLIVIDRYIVVCHPLRGPRLCSRKRVATASVLITMFAIIFYTHCFRTTMIVKKPSGKGVQCVVQKDSMYALTIITYIDSILTIGVPFLAIFILNCSLISAVRKFNNKHVRFSERKLYSYSPQYSILTKAQIRLTVMLVVVSSVFLILNLPSHAIRLYIMIKGLVMKRQNSITLILIQQIFQILYYANFAINFILYMVSSKQFRKCLKESPKCRVLRRLRLEKTLLDRRKEYG